MPSLDRRSLLGHAMVLTGATLAPGFSLEAFAVEVAAGPPYLTPERFALLTALADTIVPKTDTPGAVEIGVPKMIDGLLRNWASPSRRTELVASLDLVGALGDGFANLDLARRTALLGPHDVAALQPVGADEPAAPGLKAAPTIADPNYGKLKQEPADGKAAASTIGEKQASPRKPVARGPMVVGPPVRDPGYAKLKELIVVLYYYSEPALTQELHYEHAPGPWQPSIPLTPQSRPWGGFGFA